MEPKITNAMRELCYRMDRKGFGIHATPEMWGAMVAAGLLVWTGHEHEVTPFGRVTAAAWRKRLDGRNRNARGRSDAMRSLGMRRTSYGWE